MEQMGCLFLIQLRAAEQRILQPGALQHLQASVSLRKGSRKVLASHHVSTVDFAEVSSEARLELQ